MAARQPERLRHSIGIEPAQPADRRGGTERTEHARTMPAFGAEGAVIEADPDPGRHFATAGDGYEEVAARCAVTLGDGQSGRHDFRRHVRQRRPVHVAHGHRGDQVAV